MLQAAELSGQADSENNREGSPETMCLMWARKTITIASRTQLVNHRVFFNGSGSSGAKSPGIVTPNAKASTLM